MSTPAQTFWMHHANIDRLLAEEGQRLATIGMIAQSDGASAESFMAALRKQQGEVVVFDGTYVADPDAPPPEVLNPKRDRDGLLALKGQGGIHQS